MSKEDKNRNFKVKEYKKNRNSLRYLLTNPFEEPIANTILNFLKENSIYIKNKTETYTGYLSDLRYEFKIKNTPTFLDIHISKDHLITIKINSKIISKTRSVHEVIFILKNKLIL